MSMSQPLEPSLPPGRDGIPAADPGAGAPPPAEGFGVGGEEPDRPPADEGQDDDEGDAGPPAETPFRTPDPREIGPDAPGSHGE